MPDDFGRRDLYPRSSHTQLLAIALLAAMGQVLTLAAAFFPAWSFGGVLPRSLPWLYPVLGVAVGCGLLAHGVVRWRAFGLPPVTWILLAALGLGACQLVPLSSATLARLSPGAARFRAALLAPPPEAGAAAERASTAAPLSLEPAATRQDLATLCLVVLMFVAGAMLFAGDTARRRLCVALAIQGALVAFFSLTQLLSQHAEAAGNWRNAFHSTSWFGPFINRNNEGGYLNLCLGGALAVLLWTIRRDEQLPESAGPQISTPRERIVQLLLTPFAHLRASVLFALGLCGLIVAQVFCSLSRGAMLSMLAGLSVMVLAAAHARRRVVRLWPLGLALAAGLGLVVWIGGAQRVQHRMETMLTPAALDLGRVPHWRDALRAASDFWPLGSGWGTYRRVYPAYQHRSDIYWYRHAENQPLEALVVGGLPGLLLLLAAAGLMARAARRALYSSRGGWSSDFALGMIFLLTAQYAQGLVDFGLYLPANALLLALACGALAARRTDELAASGGAKRLASAALLVLIGGGAAWGWCEIRAVAAVNDAYHATRAVADAEQPNAAAVRQAIELLTAALAARPDDADGQFQLAVLWVQAYRAAALAQLGKEYPAAKTEKLNELTTLVNLYRSAQEFQRAGNQAALAQLRSAPLIRERLTQARQHAILAREACPNMSEPHMLLAQLSVLQADGDPREHLRRVELVAPSYGPMLHRCACMELLAGHVDEACRVWRLAIASDEDYLAPQAVAACVGVLSPQQIVDRILPDSPRLLLRLAKDCGRDPRRAGLQQALLAKAGGLVERAGLPAGERAYLQGLVHSLNKRYDRALASYAEAVKLRPQELSWRFELAQLLLQQGRLDEALDEIRMCVRMDLRNSQYRILLEQIHQQRLRGEVGPSNFPKP